MLGNARRKLHPKPGSAGSRPPLGAVQRAARLRGQAGVLSPDSPKVGQNAKPGFLAQGGGGGCWGRKAPSARTPVVASFTQANEDVPGTQISGKTPTGKQRLCMSAGVAGVLSSPTPPPPALGRLTSLPLTPGRRRLVETRLPGAPAEVGAGALGARAVPAALGPSGQLAPRPLHLRGPSPRARSPSPCGERARLPVTPPAGSRESAGRSPRQSGLGWPGAPGPQCCSGRPPSQAALPPAPQSELALRPPAPGAAPAAPDWPQRAPELLPDWAAGSRGGGAGRAPTGPAPGDPRTAASRLRCTQMPQSRR